MLKNSKKKSLSEEELQRRLDANNGYLRDKFNELGERALVDVIFGADWKKVSEKLQFIRRSWLDNNEDLTKKQTVKSYIRKYGIKKNEVYLLSPFETGWREGQDMFIAVKRNNIGKTPSYIYEED